MAAPFKTLMAATMLVVPLGSALAADASDRPVEVQRSNATATPATRILETRQETQPTAIGVLGSPAALARWVDEQRGRRVAVGLTIFR
jgi:hypothetical protein